LAELYIPLKQCLPNNLRQFASFNKKCYQDVSAYDPLQLIKQKKIDKTSFFGT